MGRHQFSGEQQPRGGVDEQRRAAADVRLPVAVADFVADQRIAGGFIRNTQQGFRRTSAPPLPVKRGRTPAAGSAPYRRGRWRFLVAQFFRQLIRQLVRLFAQRLRQTGLLQQHRYRVGFRTSPRR